jgi:hypothetical protein
MRRSCREIIRSKLRSGPHDRSLSGGLTNCWVRYPDVFIGAGCPLQFPVRSPCQIVLSCASSSSSPRPHTATKTAESAPSLVLVVDRRRSLLSASYNTRSTALSVFDDIAIRRPPSFLHTPVDRRPRALYHVLCSVFSHARYSTSVLSTSLVRHPLRCSGSINITISTAKFNNIHQARVFVENRNSSWVYTTSGRQHGARDFTCVLYRYFRRLVLTL